MNSLALALDTARRLCRKPYNEGSSPRKKNKINLGLHRKGVINMGADLYLKSDYAPNSERWKPYFDKWVEKRDALCKEGKKGEADKAQEQVVKYYERIFEQGFFRDSYNHSSLLWKFDMSWWTDVLGVLTNSKGLTSPRNAKRFLRIFEENEPVFEQNLKKLEHSEGGGRAEAERYFRNKYKRLKAFLQEAIKRRESIECSL